MYVQLCLVLTSAMLHDVCSLSHTDLLLSRVIYPQVDVRSRCSDSLVTAGCETMGSSVRIILNIHRGKNDTMCSVLDHRISK